MDFFCRDELGIKFAVVLNWLLIFFLVCNDLPSQVLEARLLQYEASCHGPGKWQKLSVFLQQR